MFICTRVMFSDLKPKVKLSTTVVYTQYAISW